jgi:predicted O-methyltransferase YrrM
MKAVIRFFAERLTQALLRIPFVGKGMAFLAYQHRRMVRQRIESKLRADGCYKDEVQLGPFCGMIYPPPTPKFWVSCRFEKIVGTYEHELHSLLENIAVTKNYGTIVNIGAAEGFFTVGLARKFPQSRLIAFESNPVYLHCQEEIARLNGVASRIESHGLCTTEDLLAISPQRPVLVWMDVDGGERSLLEPAKVPWLYEADILVELHDCLQPGLSELIRERFSTTHKIKQITNAGIEYSRYPILRHLLFTEIHSLVGEDRRGIQDWFFMEPKRLAS